jgi:single-strand DNA-binding protein
MTDMITITGLVATTPRHLITTEGLPITSFRLASTQRRFDRSQERWVDGETNWYTVTTFRQMAINVAGSVQKGDRVVATGRLRIRDWTAGEKAGTNIEVDADAIGHDLSWGTAVFTRSIVSAVAGPAAAPAAEPADEKLDDDDVEAELPERSESVAVPF